MPKMKTMACLALPLLFAGLFAACTEPRETMTESRTVDLDGATRAEVRLRMGAGELRLKIVERENGQYGQRCCGGPADSSCGQI